MVKVLLGSRVYGLMFSVEGSQGFGSRNLDVGSMQI